MISPEAQQAWAALPVRQRLAVLRRVRHRIAEAAESLAQAAARPGASQADILVAEVMPLLAAIRFLERRAAGLLAPQRPSRGRPVWLFGTRLEIRRLPLGRILVIAPANYPLLLPAVQLMQALAAGNAVAVKPALGHAASMAALAGLLADSGLPHGLVRVLDDSPAAGEAAVGSGEYDLVVLTGASTTGRAVLARAAPLLLPAIMELSGEDPFVVLAGADAKYAAQALAFGLAFNAGDTCIAPRRVIVVRAMEAAFRAALPPGAAFTVVESNSEALTAANNGAYALGAAVFGPPQDAAAFARRLRAGCVVVGDAVAPTADPRLPFGGAGESGFGTTRGAEGLLALTRPQAIVTRRKPEWRHLARLDAAAAPMVSALLRVAYGSNRVKAGLSAITEIRRQVAHRAKSGT